MNLVGTTLRLEMDAQPDSTFRQISLRFNLQANIFEIQPSGKYAAMNPSQNHSKGWIWSVFA